jgi:GGDEF domain-containing protein
MSENPAFDPDNINQDDLSPTVPFENASAVEKSVYETAYKNARLMLENERLHDQSTTFARGMFHRDDKIRELTEENKELETRVRIDPDTELMNKVAWKQEVAAAIERAEKDGNQFGILFIDLTNFKWINDAISHVKGDKVLLDVADILRYSVRHKDEKRPADLIAHEQMIGLPEGVASRHGGDEFALLVDLTPQEASQETDPDTDRNNIGLNVVIERLRDEVQLLLKEEPGLKKGGFDIAIGGCVWEKGMTTDNLLKKAGDAMKADKESQHQQKGKYR